MIYTIRKKLLNGIDLTPEEIKEYFNLLEGLLFKYENPYQFISDNYLYLITKYIENAGENLKIFYNLIFNQLEPEKIIPTEKKDLIQIIRIDEINFKNIPKVYKYFMDMQFRPLFVIETKYFNKNIVYLKKEAIIESPLYLTIIKKLVKIYKTDIILIGEFKKI